MRTIKQSTAYNLTVFMAAVTDHVTGKAGLTLTITASKAGGAFASITPTVTELTNGWYALALTTSHTDTLGDLSLHVTGTGADPTDVTMQVTANILGDTLPANVTQFGGANATTSAGRPEVNTTHFAGTSQTARDIGASVLLSSGTGTGQVSLSSGTVTVGTNTDKTGYTASTVTDKTGYSLTSAYDPAKTAAQAGDAMALTTGERTSTASAVWASSTRTLSSFGTLVADIWTAVVDSSGVTTLLGRLTDTRADNLDNLDATVSSRLADADYVDAAGTRAALGLASANLDTQLASIADDAADAKVAAEGAATPADVEASLNAATAEPTSALAANASLRQKVSLLFALGRNKLTSNGATGVRTLYADDGTTPIATAADSDSGGDTGTLTRGELS